VGYWPMMLQHLTITTQSAFTEHLPVVALTEQNGSAIHPPNHHRWGNMSRGGVLPPGTDSGPDSRFKIRVYDVLRAQKIRHGV
jgi:hypothetical protein